MPGNKKPSKKSVSIPKTRLKEVSKQPPPPDEFDASEEETDDDEDSGVDEQGLEKLMNALGEDGLDEFDLAQLRTLTGSAAGEEESGEEDDGSSDGEENDAEQVEEEGGSSEGEDIALDDEDVDSVDQDAIPQRKVQVDNKACPPPSLSCLLANLILWVDRARTHTGHHQTGPITCMDRNASSLVSRND
jgi:rRNA-processing protein EBP2